MFFLQGIQALDEPDKDYHSVLYITVYVSFHMRAREISTVIRAMKQRLLKIHKVLLHSVLYLSLSKLNVVDVRAGKKKEPTYNDRAFNWSPHTERPNQALSSSY